MISVMLQKGALNVIELTLAKLINFMYSMPPSVFDTWFVSKIIK